MTAGSVVQIVLNDHHTKLGEVVSVTLDSFDGQAWDVRGARRPLRLYPGELAELMARAAQVPRWLALCEAWDIAKSQASARRRGADT